MKYYIITYVTLILAAIILLVSKRKSCTLFGGDYRRFLLVPWKVTTFLIGAVGTAVIAPYSGDPTWDYFDALFMASFTFLSAPWSIGTIWKWLRRERSLWELFAALCLWFFSASWSYDLYILWRDGAYPQMWRDNLYASSFLYIMAGLLWNLEWRQGRGATFAFLHEAWPARGEPQPFRKIIWYVLPVAVLVALLFIEFVVRNYWG
jgi:hypothetical protein